MKRLSESYGESCWETKRAGWLSISDADCVAHSVLSPLTLYPSSLRSPSGLGLVLVIVVVEHLERFLAVRACANSGSDAEHCAN